MINVDTYTGVATWNSPLVAPWATSTMFSITMSTETDDTMTKANSQEA